MAKPVDEESKDTILQQVNTAQSILMTPDLFEKLYLTPHTAAKGELRSILGNPSPLALVGLLVGLSPLAADLMGWRGSGGNGAASTGAFYFIGGLLLVISGVLDFFLRNTFPFVVFTSYGGYFLAYAATLTPSFNAAGAYSPSGDASQGELTPMFQASFGFFLLSMALLSFTFVLCSLRTNISLFIIFLGATIGFSLLTASCWNIALGKMATAVILQKGGGGCFFVSAMTGYYLLFSQLFEAVDFPFQLPVGDLSHLIKGKRSRISKA